MEIKIRKDYGEELIQKVFVKETNSSLLKAEAISNVLKSAKDTICIVCEKGLNENLLSLLQGTSARKYLIVNKIDENKYKTLSDLIIVREVPNIQGNYMVIDKKAVIFFDEKMNLLPIIDDKIALNVFKIFIKEFWDYADFEFINKKQVAAETTFDIAPIYSTEKEEFIIDSAFDNRISDMFHNAETKYVAKAINSPLPKKLYFKSIKGNENTITNITNQEAYYVPELMVNAIETNGKTYITNCNIEEYGKTPEKGTNRFFAINVNEFDVGERYKFYNKEKISFLVNKNCLDVNGNKLNIEQSDSVNREVSVDLYTEDTLRNMAEDMREGILEKLNPNIFSYNGMAEEVTFNISTKLRHKTFTQMAKIYDQYSYVKKSLSDYKQKVLNYCKSNKETKMFDEVNRLNVDFSSVEEYNKVADRFIDVAKKINAFGFEDIDEDLQAVSKGKQKAKLEVYNKQNLSEDLPKYGTLYQSGNTFEYVLADRKNLHFAVEEMHGKKTEYFLE